MPVSTSRFTNVLLLVLLTGTCGCYQTPHQRLIGRWYSAEMSLRLNADGTAIYSSPSGLSVGRYEYLGNELGLSERGGRPANLIVDVAGEGHRSRYFFVAEFLAYDRLRLQDVTTLREISVTPRAISFAILKRASDEAAPVSVSDTGGGNSRRS